MPVQSFSFDTKILLTVRELRYPVARYSLLSLKFMFEGVFHLPKNRKESSSLCVIGYLFFSLGLMITPCFLMGLHNGEPVDATGIPMVIGLVIGILLILRYKTAEFMRPVNALTVLGQLWAASFLFGMLPWMIQGYSPFDALFESVSGLTTTGASIIPDVGVLPRSLLLWRQMTNWIGGIMIILLVMFVLPMVGFGNRNTISNEMSGSSGSFKISVKVKDAAIQFMVVYILLSVLMVVLLMLCGVNLYDSLCIMLPTLPTGGFGCLVSYNDYNTANLVKIIIIVFMFLGATNFYLHFRALFFKQTDVYRKNTEFMVMLGLVVAVSVAVFLIVNPTSTASALDTFIDCAFIVTSSSSTTGLTSVDFTQWPSLAMVLVYIMCIIGGSSGSTAGGIKVFRIVVLFQYIKTMFQRVMNPNNVRNAFRGKETPVSESEIRSVLVVIFMVLVTLVTFSFVLMVFGIDPNEAVVTVISIFTSFGPSIGSCSVAYDCMPDFIKVCLALVMWLGRLEVVTALAILSPSTWKEQIRDWRYHRRLDAESRS